MTDKVTLRIEIGPTISLRTRALATAMAIMFPMAPIAINELFLDAGWGVSLVAGILGIAGVMRMGRQMHEQDNNLSKQFDTPEEAAAWVATWTPKEPKA